jgi:hypothetical protein
MVQQRGSRRAPQVDRDATLFQGLELNAVDEVGIFQGSEKTTLSKRDGTWVIASLYDYPADFNKLADALRAASEVKTGLPVRSANVDAAEYGFDAPKALVLKRGGEEAAEIDIGARREASDAAGWAGQHFIRKGKSDAIYLVDYDFRSFDANPDRWIERSLFNIPPSDIVRVQTPDAELKEDAGEWILTGLDEATEELDTAEAGKLRGALQYLNAVSVADPAASDADLGLTNAVVYTAATTNKTITVKIGGETEKGRYVRFGGDVPERIGDWTYIIGSYNAGSFLVPREKLVTEKENAPPAEVPAAE